jgi:hypothetical protein
VVEDDVDLEEQLQIVRHELEVMISARSVCAFTTNETIRFEDLLERELALLRGRDWARDHIGR